MSITHDKNRRRNAIEVVLSGERLFNELHRLHPAGWSSWERLNADEQREVAQALSVVMEDREQVPWQRIKEENQRAIDAEQRVRHLEAERDRMAEGWAAANEGVNERLDQAFLDGYGAAYIKARPDRFVAMADFAEEAAWALAEWHKADEDTDGSACPGCGADIDDDRTNCGALECGGGSLPDIGGSP